MPSRSPTVLLVDDEPLGREVLEAMLADDGFTIATASDGVEALAKARELLPDLVLLDVMMPGLDGFEVVRRLRGDPALAEMPVILVTALHDRDSRLQGLDAGADDFVTKPIDRIELLARVRTVTRLDRFRRLLSERAKFEWAVETADDGFLLVDTQDRVLYANPRARLLLGLPADAALPQEAFRSLGAAHYRCEPEEAWAAWPQAPHPADPTPRYLVRPETAAAPSVWLHVDTFPLPSRNEALWLVRLRDVSERLQARREVWAFHTAVQHKLRTPLAAMIPSLEMLAVGGSDMTADVIASFASAAFRGAERLNGAIQDVLDYLEVSRQPSSTEGFDLPELAPLAREVASELGIASLAIAGEGDVGRARVALSTRAIELLLWELMENAKKFHPRREPAVEVLLTRPSAERAGLTLRDDGVSLAPEHLARAFSPYYQGERQHTGQVAGMGLGLSMVGSMVWSIGGACRLSNRADGPGVAVELLLPILT